MRTRRFILAFAVLALLAHVAAAYVFIPPVSQRQLRVLPTSCRTNQVLAVLGSPTRTFQSSGQEFWEYSSWRSFQTLQFIVGGDGQCSCFHFEP